MGSKISKKLGIRILIVNVVFVAIKLSIEPDPNESYINRTTFFYYFSALFLFLTGWEINDYLIKNGYFKSKFKGREIVRNLKILGLTVLISMVFAAIIYYSGLFHFSTFCGIETTTPWSQFMVDMMRALFLSTALCVFNQFYWISRDKSENKG